MTKKDSERLMNDLRNGVKFGESLSEIHDLCEPLEGLGTRDFEDGKFVSYESVLTFLRWQCMQFNGQIDQDELSDCLGLLKRKRVAIV